MTPRQRALQLIAEHDAELFNESQPGRLDLTVWSPVGSVWAANYCHSLAAFSVGYGEDREAGWRDLAERLEMGLEPCDKADCDTCHPEEPG